MYRMTPHPAILQLLRFQASARIARTLQRFRGRRRLILSILAVLLTIAWLGQVAAGLLLRAPADPEKLAVWIPMGLLAYAIWHLLKAACHTPIEPFEWTPAEQELLGGAPLRRYDLVTYRLIAIAIAAVAKAACFSLVMLPDLRIWLAGFAGMLMALLFVDLVRMSIEIVVYGMSCKEFIRFRIAVLGLAAVCGGAALARVFPLDSPTGGGELPTSLAIAMRIVNALLDLRHTGIGPVVEAPFAVFANVILAPSFSAMLLTNLLIAGTLIVALGAGVIWLDLHFQQRRVAAERSAFLQPRRSSATTEGTNRDARHPVRLPLRLQGAGSLAWRQTLGAIHYRTSLSVAMIVPGILSCTTLFTPHRGRIMLIQIVGGLVFYSFLLLPTAFKFDFRRDIDRLAVLKGLPISPTAVTLGQLAVPVLLCSLFQLVVLLVAIVVRPYPIGWLCMAMLVLIPTNVLIFALENLIFLLYPYRLNQEGLGVFFRSILTFTGKGILFAGALAIALIWAFVARYLTFQLLPANLHNIGSFIFISGMWALTTAAAAITTALLIGVYRRFDPSQDTPAAC